MAASQGCMDIDNASSNVSTDKNPALTAENLMASIQIETLFNAYYGNESFNLVEYICSADTVEAQSGSDKAHGSIIGFEKTPPELLEQIFHFLDRETLTEIIPHVCKRWKNATQIGSLYKKMFFSRHVGKREIKKALKEHSNHIQLLQIEDFSVLETLMEKQISQMNPILPRLKYLLLDDCSDFYINVHTVQQLKGYFPQLKRVKVQEPWISTKERSSYVRELFTELHTKFEVPLHMDMVFNIKHAESTLFEEEISMLQKLDFCKGEHKACSFKVCMSNIDFGKKPVADAFKSCPRNVKLALTDPRNLLFKSRAINCITEFTGSLTICEMMCILPKTCPNLQALKIKLITEVPDVPDVDAVLEFPNLEHVELSTTTDASFPPQMFGTFVSRVPRLKRLICSKIKSNAAFLYQLSRCVKSLELSCNLECDYTLLGNHNPFGHQCVLDELILDDVKEQFLIWLSSSHINTRSLGVLELDMRRSKKEDIGSMIKATSQLLGSAVQYVLQLFVLRFPYASDFPEVDGLLVLDSTVLASRLLNVRSLTITHIHSSLLEGLMSFLRSGAFKHLQELQVESFDEPESFHKFIECAKQSPDLRRLESEICYTCKGLERQVLEVLLKTSFDDAHVSIKKDVCDLRIVVRMHANKIIREMRAKRKKPRGRRSTIHIPSSKNDG